jgi:hypothetical protein
MELVFVSMVFFGLAGIGYAGSTVILRDPEVAALSLGRTGLNGPGVGGSPLL